MLQGFGTSGGQLGGFPSAPCFRTSLYALMASGQLRSVTVGRRRFNRTLGMEAPRWPGVRNILLALGVLAALAGGAAFLIGLNMMWNVSASSSSHPKSGLQKRAPAPAEPQKSPSAASHGNPPMSTVECPKIVS